MIYLDYAATTPIDEQVFDSYFKLLKNYARGSAEVAIYEKETLE